MNYLHGMEERQGIADAVQQGLDVVNEKERLDKKFRLDGWLTKTPTGFWDVKVEELKGEDWGLRG
jgi:hypothetical protein